MKYDRSVGKFPQLEAPPGAQAGAGEKREGVRQKLKLLSLQQYNNKDKITIRGTDVAHQLNTLYIFGTNVKTES